MEAETAEENKAAFLAWVRLNKWITPALKLVLPVNNESNSLILLPVPKHGYHGLFLEFNIEAKGNHAALDALLDQAYSVAACRTWFEGRRVIEGYLRNV